MNNLLFFPFATPIILSQIDGDLSALREDSSYLSGTLQYPDQPWIPSEHNDRLRVLQKYPEICKEIEDKFNYSASELYSYDYDWWITTSWITCNSKGDRIHNHNHVNCLWSGILYQDDYYPDDLSPLILQNPYYDNNQLEVQAHSPYNPYTANYKIKAKPGALVFWPSHIIHSSDTFTTDFMRRSLAFNLMPRKLYGRGNDSRIDLNWINDRK